MQSLKKRNLRFASKWKHPLRNMKMHSVVVFVRVRLEQGTDTKRNMIRCVMKQLL